MTGQKHNFCHDQACQDVLAISHGGNCIGLGRKNSWSPVLTKAFRSGAFTPLNMVLRMFFLIFPLFFIWVGNVAAQAQIMVAPHENRVNEGEPVLFDITVLDVPQGGLNMVYRLVQYGNPQFRPAGHVESIHHDSVFIPHGNQGTVTISLETEADNFREKDYEIGFSVLSLTGAKSGEILDAVCSTASEPYYFRTISAGCTEHVTVRDRGWELQAPKIPSSMIYASLSAPPLVAPGAMIPVTARLSAPAPAFGMTVHFAMYETDSNFLADSLAPHSPRFIRHEIFIPPGQTSMTRTYQLRHTDGIARNCIVQFESTVSGPARGCIFVEIAEPKGINGKPGSYGIYPTRAQIRPQEIPVVDHAPEFPVAEPVPDEQTRRKAFTFQPVKASEPGFDIDIAAAEQAKEQGEAQVVTSSTQFAGTEETDSGIDSTTAGKAQPGQSAETVETAETVFVSPPEPEPEHGPEMMEEARDQIKAQTMSVDDEITTEAGAAGTIDIDNSILPEIFIDDLTIDEHGGPAFFTISISTTPVHEVRVDIATSDGSARQGEDYTAVQARAVFVPDGPLSLKLPVSILDDTDSESVETFIVQLSEAEHAVITKKIGTVAIVDNDATHADLPAQLPDGNTGPDGNIETDENTQHAEFGTEISGTDNTTVVNDFPNHGPAGKSVDPSAFSVTIADNSPAAMNIDVFPDSPVMTFTPQVGQPISQIPEAENKLAGTDAVNTAIAEEAIIEETVAEETITDEAIADKPDMDTQNREIPKLPEISISDSVITEHEGQVVFTISLSNASRNRVSVNVSTMDITATEPNDYIGLRTTLSLAPGQRDIELMIPVNDDKLSEDTETFAVRLDTPAYAVIARDTGIGTIADDDAGMPGRGPDEPGHGPDGPGHGPEMFINDVSVNENAGEAVFAISLSEAVSDPVTVNAATRNGSAVHPDDYTGTSTVVTFMPGETLQYFRVPLVDNDIPEPDRTFRVVLDDASGATIAESGGTGGTGIIVDDGDPVPDISISDAILSNDGTMALFSIFLSRPSGMTVSVNAETRDGTARQPDDYTGTLKQVIFAPKETVQQFSVPLARNEIPRSFGMFTVELNNAVNAVIGDQTGQAFPADNDGQVTVTDNNGQAAVTDNNGQIAVADNNGQVAVTDDKHAVIAGDVPQLSVDDITVSEHDQVAVFVMSLSRASAEPVTVRVATKDGSAVYPEDYIRRTKYLEFEPGILTQNLDIPLVDDNIPESDETFAVQLFEPEGAVLMTEIVIGTILDNDDDVPETLSRDKPAPSNREHAEINGETDPDSSGESANADSEKPASVIQSPDVASKANRGIPVASVVRADRQESGGSTTSGPTQAGNRTTRIRQVNPTTQPDTIPTSGGRVHPGFIAGSAFAIYRFQQTLRQSPDIAPAGSNISVSANARFSSGSVTGRFLLDRQRAILNGMPGTIRFFRQRRRSPSGLWGEITGTRGRSPDGANAHYTGSFGFHKLRSQQFLYGAIFQLHSTSTGSQTRTGGISGRSWLAGPYFAARFKSWPVYLEGKLLFGESANTLEPGGSGLYYRRGSFNTSRILAQLRLETDFDFGRRNGKLVPYADLRWSRDQAKPFETIAGDGSRDQVGGQVIQTGQVELGSGIEIPVNVGRGEMLLNAAAGVILSRAKGSHTGESSTHSGRVSAGLQYRLDENAFYEFKTFLDGIALPGYQEYGISLTAEYRF